MLSSANGMIERIVNLQGLKTIETKIKTFNMIERIVNLQGLKTSIIFFSICV